MDPSFASRGKKKKNHAYGTRIRHDRVHPTSFPDLDLPNHNQPKACTDIPGAGPRTSRPGSQPARTRRAGPLQAAGDRAPPRPRGLSSPPTQRGAFNSASPARAAESRPGTASLEQLG